MKLKYKKLVIVITVVTLALSFLILTLIPTGGSNPTDAEDAELIVNDIEEINTLISDYLSAKKAVNIDAMGALVSDANQIDRDKLVAMAEYVEDYMNINCYVIENEDTEAYRVYAKYDMKVKNIDTLVPCLTAFYVTVTSEGKYIIYMSALDSAQEDFITSADKNSELIELTQQVAAELENAIAKDAAFKQFYQKLDKEIQAAESNAASGAAATVTPAN